MADRPTLYERFAASADTHGDRTALETGGRTLTYTELRSLAEHNAARLLAALDGRRPARVGILAGRGVAAYASYLAAQRLGATVVPLNPDSAPDRVTAVLAAARPDAVLTDRNTALTCPVVAFEESADGSFDRPPRTSPSRIPTRSRTSSSRPAPPAPPRASRCASATRPRCSTTPSTATTSARTAASPRPSTSPSTPPRGTCSPPGAPERPWSSPPAANWRGRMSFIARARITHWFSVPSLISYALRLRDLAPGSMPGLRWSLFGGEQLTLEQAAAWREAAPGSVLENLYGPTEVTVSCTQFRLPAEPADWPVTANGTVPIGTPYPHLDFLVLGEDGRPADEGELCLRGPQRFPGYLDPGENPGRFLRFDGREASVYEDREAPGEELYYRTGDRVRVGAGGALLHLGRLDHQVKVAGHRVELGEIEAALRAAEGVAEAVVTVLKAAPGAEPTLEAAYTGAPRDPLALRAELSGRLPAYMLPRAFTHFETFPLNANRKIDRLAVTARLAEPHPDTAW